MKRLAPLVVLLFAACSSSPTTTENAAQSQIPATSQASIEGLPVPSIATRHALPTDDENNQAWEIPASYALGDLRAWFNVKLPRGRAFGAWAWCDLSSADQWSWNKGARALTLQIADDDPSGKPYVLENEQDGPC